MATMTLSPASAAPGTAITITGSGFANNAKTKVAVESVPILTFKASNSGSFTKTIYAPSGANRNVAIVATCFIGHSWIVVATATLAIVNVGPPVDTTKPVISAVAAGSITQTSATVTWTTNEPATTQVEYGPVPNLGSVTAKVSTLVTSHSQVLTPLTPGVQYRYRVWSADAANNTEWSEAGAPFTTSAPSPVYTAPGAPASLTATGGNNLVDLAWTAPVSNGGTAITGYRIYRGGNLLIALGNVLTYQNTGLVNNQAYSYQVTAINAVGEGPPSVSRSATPGDTIPPTVSGIAHGSVTQTTATVSWSINEPATGQVEYGLTTSYNLTTTLEPGYLLAHAQPLSGLSPGQLYHYRAKSLDVAGNPGYSGDRTFTTLVPTAPSASAIYGPGISGDGLGNTRFQGSLRIQSCRFRAAQSSALTAFTFYYLGPPDPGYALGTGGTWKAEIFADDGTSNYPTGSPIATKSVAALGGSDADRVITFTSPATLVAGTLYHLVFTLTDASPDANHFSTDHWFTRQVPTGAPDGRIVPRFPLTDWAHLYYEHPSGPWVTRSQYTPILDLAYANGQHQGMSYGEAQYGPNDVGKITGTSNMVRERFTVSGGNRSVTGAGIRLLRQSGTDPLTVRLEDNAGTLIDSFTIAAALVPTGPAPTGANNSDNDLGVNAKWLAGVFAATRTLVNGTAYRLRLSTAAGSIYWAWTNRRLSESYPNYTAATAFQDGYAEVTTNGSTWSALGVDVNQYDLQFYLAVAPSANAGFILIDRATLLALPTSGTAWTAMKARADTAVGTPNIANQDDGADVTVLAKALVYARISTTSYQTAALAGIKAAVGTETGAFLPGTSSALALGRQLGAYVLSADLISLPTLDPTYDQNVFRPWLRSLLTMTLDGRTLQSNHEDRPNNWGTHAGASRAAVAAYLSDSAEMARTALVFRGYLGDRSAYAGFNYGDDLTWQANPALPVGINPTGAVIGGVNVDGILPDDMRRGGSFPTVGDLGQSYTWEALQGILLQAELLSRNGYPAWGWSNNAIWRAFTRIHALGYPAAGDDRWTPWLVNRRYGSSFPAPTTTTAGKGFGYADWLYG